MFLWYSHEHEISPDVELSLFEYSDLTSKRMRVDGMECHPATYGSFHKCLL